MLYNDLKEWQLILASSSPRRSELLKNLGLEFKQITLPFEESFPDDLNNVEIAAFLAEQKADQVLKELTDRQIAITADTLVCYDDKVLGKPGNRDEAILMIKELSGNRHLVITGVCILTTRKRRCFISVTEVLFTDLETGEIEYYVDKFKPYDKAGAYGIQEWIGYVGVEEITGSYFNVMGLPVQRLYIELKDFIKTLK